MYILQFDGMLRASNGEWPGSLGLLGYGWIIKRDDVEIARGFGLFLCNCMAGSNAAEYLALIEGLDALADLRIRDEVIEIRGDAKCVIDQMLGHARVSSPITQILNRRARKLASRFAVLTWIWVPRRENRHADGLSRRSFRYLHYSAYLKQEVNDTESIPLYGGRFVSLLDLRVHAPGHQPVFV